MFRIISYVFLHTRWICNNCDVCYIIYEITNSLFCRKIFVGGLPPHASEDDVRKHFSQFGGVEHCSLKTDAETGRSRGFAFITFSSVEEANAVR